MLQVIAISLGASVGALSRWQLSLWLNQGHAVLPWGTLAANWVGAWLIGVAVVFFQSQTQLDPAWRLALVTGFLGALTTFSTFSMDTLAAFHAGHPAKAMLNIGLNTTLCLTATAAAYFLIVP